MAKITGLADVKIRIDTVSYFFQSPTCYRRKHINAPFLADQLMMMAGAVRHLTWSLYGKRALSSIR